MSKETIISIIISATISFIISYCFWKKPISTEFKFRRSLYQNKDTEKEVTYKIGYNNTGWQIEKIISKHCDNGEIFKSYANQKNNPTIIKEPETLEEVIGLHFE